MQVQSPSGRSVWIAQAGPPEDLHHVAGPYEVPLERMTDELSQLVKDIASMLAFVKPGESPYTLDEVRFEVTFDSRVGFALVGSKGDRGSVSLRFTRVPGSA